MTEETYLCLFSANNTGGQCRPVFCIALIITDTNNVSIAHDYLYQKSDKSFLLDTEPLTSLCSKSPPTQPIV